MSYIFWDIMLYSLFKVQWTAWSQKTELFTTTAENLKAYREGTCPLTYEVHSKRKSCTTVSDSSRNDRKKHISVECIR